MVQKQSTCKAVLLSFTSRKIFSKLKDFCSPQKPTEKTFEEFQDINKVTKQEANESLLFSCLKHFSLLVNL